MYLPIGVIRLCFILKLFMINVDRLQAKCLLFNLTSVIAIQYFNSERSDECIDFTMMCVASQNNASISSFGSGFRWQSEYPCCIIEVKRNNFPIVFKKIEKNKKKVTKTGIFTQNQFSTKSNFYMAVTQKLITVMLSD
ncbi:Uncharacterized protein FWK35_00019824 [Aphis craccivora]|uniref:Uncharacterized protein n=1 Tax=Aphis craccivora TaxID=307492 RepID=A0A6G0ZH26_APHCR|nr:Uncharacterized protein FWK35_00019824 [Aphis craccivora]